MAGYPFSDTDFPAPCKELAELAKSEDKPNSVFPGHLPKLKAFALDQFSQNRLKTYTGTAFASADAFLHGKDGTFYFIEFKDQPTKNINADDIHKKVFGSFLAIAMTIAQKQPMRSIMKNSVFIVVFPKENYLNKTGQLMANWAGEKTLWHLDKLKKAEMLQNVYTVDDEQFSRLPFLNNFPSETESGN